VVEGAAPSERSFILSVAPLQYRTGAGPCMHSVISDRLLLGKCSEGGYSCYVSAKHNSTKAVLHLISCDTSNKSLLNTCA